MQSFAGLTAAAANRNRWSPNSYEDGVVLRICGVLQVERWRTVDERGGVLAGLCRVGVTVHAVEDDHYGCSGAARIAVAAAEPNLSLRLARRRFVVASDVTMMASAAIVLVASVINTVVNDTVGMPAATPNVTIPPATIANPTRRGQRIHGGGRCMFVPVMAARPARANATEYQMPPSKPRIPGRLHLTV